MYDRDIAWETIRSNKVYNAEKILGMDIDEDSEHWNLIEQLIQMNDVVGEGALIREYGMNNNIPNVVQDYLVAQADSFGSGVIPATQFQEGR